MGSLRPKFVEGSRKRGARCRSVFYGACLATLAMAFLASATAWAEKRVALVVGNDLYQNLPPETQLRNAVNDARAMRDTLTGLGFEVLYGENLDRRSLVDKVFDLTARLTADDTAFIYFAGHGVAFDGANYLLPSDIPAVRTNARAEEARLAEQAIAETLLIDRVTMSGARVAILVLDACRNNPLRGANKRALGSSRGLVPAQPAKGVFTIYSAGTGQEALDRLGPDDKNPNSVFTRIFMDMLRKPGIDLKAVITETRREVLRIASAAGYEQVPAYYDQVVGGDIYLAGAPKLAPAVSASDKIAWRFLRQTNDAEALRRFISEFPGSVHATEASARIETLVREEKTRALLAEEERKQFEQALRTQQGAPLFAGKGAQPATAADEVAWSFLQNTTDTAALRRYMAEFPASRYQAEASQRIAMLTQTAEARAKSEQEQLNAISAEVRRGEQESRDPDKGNARSGVRPPDDVAWDILKGATDVEALRQFVGEFPTTEHKAEAEERIASLQREARARTDAEEEQRRRLDAEKRQASQPAGSKNEVRLAAAPATSDDIVWEFLKRSTDIEGLRRFLVDYATSPHRNAAAARLASLERESSAREEAMREQRRRLEDEARRAGVKRVQESSRSAESPKVSAAACSEALARVQLEDPSEEDRILLRDCRGNDAAVRQGRARQK